MVALPPVPGTAKIVIKQSLAGVNVFNVMHAFTSSGQPATANDLTNLATAIRASWVANVIPLQVAQLALTDVTCTDLSSDTGPEATITGNTPGTAAATALPANVAICWSWKISRRYRGGHPRTYIGGIPSSVLSNANTIIPSVQTQHIAAGTALRQAVNGAQTATGNWGLCVVHYRRAKVILPVPLTSVVNGVGVDTRLDSQRRRLGRDRN